MKTFWVVALLILLSAISVSTGGVLYFQILLFSDESAFWKLRVFIIFFYYLFFTVELEILTYYVSLTPCIVWKLLETHLIQLVLPNPLHCNSNQTITSGNAPISPKVSGTKEAYATLYYGSGLGEGKQSICYVRLW